ncbi:protein gamma response 1 [Vicia villosa]|uniref:protein gamma response 1 n=1 Tax=Vicia villosa TaxID=3911 RepID=UPI00273C14CB|nr:protein gamma response 1 [Vicia villosa]
MRFISQLHQKPTMDEKDTLVESVPHTRSPLSSPPPLPSVADDEKIVSGLSTILVASIQEAKDKISQLEYVFCSQLYPHFQSTSKNSDAKRRRIVDLEREVDEGMLLQKSLLDLIRNKESLLKACEEKEKAAISKLEISESENVKLLRKIVDLEERLGVKVKDVEVLELKSVENEGLCKRLFEEVELLKSEVLDEKLKRNRLNEAYKRLKSQHIYLRQKVGLNEENMLRENTFENESDLAKHQSPITEPGVAFDDRNVALGACINAKVKCEILEEDFEGLENRTPEIFVAVRDTNEVKKKALEDDKGASLCPPSSSFHDVQICPPSTKLVSVSGTKRPAPPEVFVAVHDTNEVKKKLEDDKRANLCPPSSSSFHDVQKCPPSTKLVSVSGTKRPAPSWRQTRSHQSRAGNDLHDDFLDTPLENIRDNLNKDLNKEDVPQPIQKDISMDSSDDETQDLNAKSSPQKQSSITVANKRSFKYVEPVRKKAERENLKGVDCKQCRKFYEAVLPNADGKDPDGNKQNIRCEHHDGVSRHRYRYVPPMTPEGFWNIGFESEL